MHTSVGKRLKEDDHSHCRLRARAFFGVLIRTPQCERPASLSEVRDCPNSTVLVNERRDHQSKKQKRRTTTMTVLGPSLNSIERMALRLPERDTDGSISIDVTSAL